MNYLRRINFNLNTSSQTRRTMKMSFYHNHLMNSLRRIIVSLNLRLLHQNHYHHQNILIHKAPNTILKALNTQKQILAIKIWTVTTKEINKTVLILNHSFPAFKGRITLFRILTVSLLRTLFHGLKFFVGMHRDGQNPATKLKVYS